MIGNPRTWSNLFVYGVAAHIDEDRCRRPVEEPFRANSSPRVQDQCFQRMRQRRQSPPDGGVADPGAADGIAHTAVAGTLAQRENSKSLGAAAAVVYSVLGCVAVVAESTWVNRCRLAGKPVAVAF